MIQVVKPARIVMGVLLCLILVISGCQKDRATAPAVKVAPTEDSPQAVATEEQKEQAASPEPNEAGPAVALALRFSPGQTTTYRATAEAQRSIEWVGPTSTRPANHSDGRTGNYAEITFEQQVEQVRANGNAVLRITIQAVKFRNEVQNKTTLDFDSARGEDQGQPLAALLGKSYRVEISPKGQVVALTDMEAVRQAVPVGSPAHNVAARLFSEEVVRDRHEIPPLTALKEARVRPGQSWSDVKSYSFGAMGFKSFERVYTLERVQRDDGRSALVEMKAIPSAAMAEEMHRRQSAGPLASPFDNTEEYEGRLDLDLDSGRVRAYSEEMRVEWVVVDPAAMRDTTAQPLAMKMGARRRHRLEQL